MKYGLNEAFVMGNLTDNPEAKTYGKGKDAGTLCKVSIAVNKGEKVDFIPVTMFGQTADYFAQNARKGARVMVRGSISTGSYETKDGEKRYTWEVVASYVQLLDYAEEAPTTKSNKRR